VLAFLLIGGARWESWEVRYGERPLKKSGIDS
jgi:hypothetical protein